MLRNENGFFGNSFIAIKHSSLLLFWHSLTGNVWKSSFDMMVFSYKSMCCYFLPNKLCVKNELKSFASYRCNLVLDYFYALR